MQFTFADVTKVFSFAEYIRQWNTKRVTYTGRFIMFSVITNIYNKKTKGLTLQLFTGTGKLKKVFFDN